MPRAKRKPKKKSKVVDNDGSDDDCHDSPDPESEEFFYDGVDKFHNNREKILLQKSGQSSDEDSEGFEQVDEVLGLDIESDEDEDDNEDDNDINDDGDMDMHEGGLSSSDEDIEKSIPSEKAWGRKKKVYYDADQYKQKDLDSEEEEDLDKEEEEEVLMLQQNMAARLDENDFDIEEFELANNDERKERQKSKEIQKSQQEKIIMDLSKLSKEEKIKLLAKDSPELFELVHDMKEKLAELSNCLHPLVQMARSGKIASSQGVEYLEMKHQLIMNYLVNICFYLLLKANQTSVKNHPVIERLVQYRELLQQLEPLDIHLQDDIEYFLNKYKDNPEEKPSDTSKGHKVTKKQKEKDAKKNVKFSISQNVSESQNSDVSPSGSGSGKKRKKLENLDPLSYYEAIRDMKKRKKEERLKAHAVSNEAELDNMDDEDNEDPDGKRGITYQISKNKGLTPKRKKEVRNPRLKHRKKFVKARIKRKSQVNPVVKELSRYGGESTGIKSHLTRSIKIK